VSHNSLARPKTLAEVAEGSSSYQDFGYHLRDFLHTFAERRREGLNPILLLASEPLRLTTRFAEGNICDAFLAGTADHLSRTSGVHTPLWALQEDRVLQEPWFAETFPQVRMRLLRDTPSAFKDKNIFVFASAFRVA